MLSDPMHSQDALALKPLRLVHWRRLEGLGVGTEPHFDDPVATQAFIDASGDGLDFGQFGHSLILIGEAAAT